MQNLKNYVKFRLELLFEVILKLMRDERNRSVGGRGGDNLRRPNMILGFLLFNTDKTNREWKEIPMVMS